MSANGPGDVPAAVRRRRRRRTGGKQQPSTEARKNAAYGSRPARPLPKPKAAPSPPPAPAGDTKSDADLGRAKRHERTQSYRGAVRDTYAEQSPDRRKQIAKASEDRPGAAAAEAERFHDERVRVNAYIKKALEYKPGDKVSDQDKVDIAKGARVAKHMAERLQKEKERLENQATDAHIAQKDAERENAGGLSIGGIVGSVKALVSGHKPGTVGFGREVHRVESEAGPVDAAGRAAMKPTLDAVTTALEQMNRAASASAGAALAATEGKSVIKGAAEGFISNDKSYTQVAKKLGLGGKAAAIVGLAGDIAFDPTTYASFGFKAPATAAERVAVRRIARRYAGDIKAAAKAGDAEESARLAAAYEKEAAAAREKASKLEQTTRGIQAGVRLPGGRTIATRGRATAAVGKQATKVTAKVQASKAARPVNEVLRMFAPHVREPGVRPHVQRDRQAAQREANALRNRVAREGRQLGKYIQRAAGGDVDRVREIIDAIEHGTVRNLDGPLREAAERAQIFHDKVASEFKELTGRDLKLADTILPRADVDEALDVARAVLDTRVSKAARRAEKVDHEADVTIAEAGAPARAAAAGAKVADAHVDLAGAESLAERIGDRERPLHIDDERELVDRLGGIVDKLREDVHTNMARSRTNDELGAIRRGEHDNAEVKAALRAEDFNRKKAADLRKAGNRQGARAAEAKARAARAVIKAHRAEVEPQHLAAVQAEGADVLKGQAGKLERLLGQLQERVAYNPPEAYVPRQTQRAMDAAAEGKPLRSTIPAQAGKTGHEAERLERRRASDVREDKPDYLSEELPQLEAKYGIKMGRRLGSLALWKRIIRDEARPVTGEFPIEGDQVLYRVDNDGLQRIDPHDRAANEQAVAEAAMRHALGDGDAGVYAISDSADELLQARQAASADKRSDAGRVYDRWLRAFKASNTILRPGFFATTIAGNMWQQFLADLNPKDMAEAWRMFAHMRSTDLKAVHPSAGVGFRGEAGGRAAILDRLAGAKTYVVDGKAMTFGQLFDEAIDAGAIRTGSRIGDPTELTLEEQAQRRIGKGAKAKAGATTEWLGEVAEDLDDMTKAIIYAKQRQAGLSPREATEFVFTKMIDYSDLSKAERMVFKRVMPFYVYTARNLPIQVKSLLARPGKLANFEKVRQALAEAAGLGDDWEGQRTEAEQERMPFALPGATSHGFQVFVDPRLPVSDLAGPAQLGEGPGGGVRMLERYASGIAPPVKVPLELLLFKRRLDYDRPIDVPGSPPAAGALMKLIGATKDGEYVQPATGEKYTGAIPAVDYLLRTFGGSPGSLAASIGADVPDRSNLDPKVRGAASFAGGFGVSASDPLYAVLDAVRKETEKHYQTRSELKGQGKRDSAADVRNEDAIDALNNVKRKIQAAIGFPEEKKNLLGLERDRLEIGTREPAEVRAERRRLDKLRHQYGG